MNVTSNPALHSNNVNHAVEGELRSASPEMGDPLIDTPMIVTLEQLKPYDLNPRVTRNPKYEEIKASIRQRGLDAPPSITRRPGEDHYRIRNGGNTRLAILRELWSETKKDQFFHLACMFRPWPKRGEIVALTGHLAENELRGGLTFIERALGVEKARELYELECGGPLSQSELSKRLTTDGYPVHQSHISRMRDAVQYLLPAIPNLLYGGLGRHQVERLAVMRRSLVNIWQEYTKGKPLEVDFPSLFHDALATFDVHPSEFSAVRVQDEMVGQMAQHLGVDYDSLFLFLETGEKREIALSAPHQYTAPSQGLRDAPTPMLRQDVREVMTPSLSTDSQDKKPPARVETTEPDRLQSIQALVAKHAGDQPALSSDVLPFTQGSLFPISDIWNIEPGLDEPQRLRIHISQFAREICQDVANVDLITEVDEGIGFHCSLEDSPDHLSSSSLISLLETLTTGTASPTSTMEIGSLLLGSNQSAQDSSRLSDASLVKLFRLIRLARRLIDLKAEGHSNPVISQKESL